MVAIYVALCIHGRRTCNPATSGVVLVPASLRPAVLAELTELGLDADGKPIV